MATIETNSNKQSKTSLNVNQTTSLNKSSSNNNQQEIDDNKNNNSSSNSSCLKSLDVKTKSIENSLLPLVNQVRLFIICFI
jgi:hypothetical protein